MARIMRISEKKTYNVKVFASDGTMLGGITDCGWCCTLGGILADMRRRFGHNGRIAEMRVYNLDDDIYAVYHVHGHNLQRYC